MNADEMIRLSNLELAKAWIQAIGLEVEDKELWKLLGKPLSELENLIAKKMDEQNGTRS